MALDSEEFGVYRQNNVKMEKAYFVCRDFSLWVLKSLLHIVVKENEFAVSNLPNFNIPTPNDGNCDGNIPWKYSLYTVLYAFCICFYWKKVSNCDHIITFIIESDTIFVCTGYMQSDSIFEFVTFLNIQKNSVIQAKKSEMENLIHVDQSSQLFTEKWC